MYYPLPKPVHWALVVQDGKYDRLLRLLYDDIQKYETEVAVVPFAAGSTALSCPASFCKKKHLQLIQCCHMSCVSRQKAETVCRS